MSKLRSDFRGLDKGAKSEEKSKKKRIVCLGGGNAMPKVVLAALKEKPIELSVVCATLDSGGCAGREREKFGTISFGDIRRSFLALSNISQDAKEVLSLRLDAIDGGTVLANTLGTAGFKKFGDYERVFKVYREILKISDNHQIYPATLDNSHLFAVLSDGQVKKGETNIDVPKHNPNLKIEKTYREPRAVSYKPAAEAIKNADFIILGPGDLYSSIVQILLVDGIKEAISQSPAKKIYICNIMEKNGETNGFVVGDFANEIEKYLGGKIDYVIYNNKEPEKERLREYKNGNEELLEPVKPGGLKENFIGADLIFSSGPISHDPEKIIKVLSKITGI